LSSQFVPDVLVAPAPSPGAAYGRLEYASVECLSHALDYSLLVLSAGSEVLPPGFSDLTFSRVPAPLAWFVSVELLGGYHLCDGEHVGSRIPVSQMQSLARFESVPFGEDIKTPDLITRRRQVLESHVSSHSLRQPSALPTFRPSNLLTFQPFNLLTF